jgi:hypothetical protein
VGDLTAQVAELRTALERLEQNAIYFNAHITPIYNSWHRRLFHLLNLHLFDYAETCGKKEGGSPSSTRRGGGRRGQRRGEGDGAEIQAGPRETNA